MVPFLLQNANTSAYLAGITSILGFLALFIFFAGVPLFGPVNDAISIFQMLFLLPVFAAFVEVLGDRNNAAVLLLTLLAAAALAIAALQLLLVLRWLQFEETLRPVLFFGMALGAWWLVTGALSLSHPALPTGLAWAGIASGLSFLTIAVAYLQVRPFHPLTALGFLVGAVAVPVWAIWLGRLIEGGQWLAAVR